MPRLSALCIVMLFTAGAAFAQEPPPGFNGPPPGAPRGIKPPPDRSLGPPPRPVRIAPPKPGEAAPLILPYPLNGLDPDPKIPANPKSMAVLKSIIAGLETDALDESKFGPGMVLSLKENGAALVAFVQAQGPLKSLSYKGGVAPPTNAPVPAGLPPPRIEEFESVHDEGVLRWRFHLGPDGKVARMAAMVPPK